MALYFIGKYEDAQNGRPRLVAKCETHLTLETAELLTTHHNEDLGHVCNDEEFTRKPGSRFFYMYDEEAAR